MRYQRQRPTRYDCCPEAMTMTIWQIPSNTCSIECSVFHETECARYTWRRPQQSSTRPQIISDEGFGRRTWFHRENKLLNTYQECTLWKNLKSPIACIRRLAAKRIVKFTVKNWGCFKSQYNGTAIMITAVMNAYGWYNPKWCSSPSSQHKKSSIDDEDIVLRSLIEPLFQCACAVSCLDPK